MIPLFWVQWNKHSMCHAFQPIKQRLRFLLLFRKNTKAPSKKEGASAKGWTGLAAWTGLGCGFDVFGPLYISGDGILEVEVSLVRSVGIPCISLGFSTESIISNSRFTIWLGCQRNCGNVPWRCYCMNLHIRGSCGSHGLVQ